jgi:hypothetical protein
VAGEIVYYCFSLIFVFGMLTWLISLVLLRINGKSLAGLSYKLGTPEHRRVVSQLANLKTITVSGAITLVFIINLVYDITRLLDFRDQEFAHALLIYGTVFTVVMWIILIPATRNQAKIAGESVKARAKK